MFDQEEIFSSLNHLFLAGSTTALLGKNGTGKSTLLQIIANYVSPSKGGLIYSKNNLILQPEEVFNEISFCAPYLELIEEMNLQEFFTYHFSFKKPIMPIPEMLSYIGLQHTNEKLIDKFSSGMKQRVKLAQAVFADTSLLLLDEPCSNLDSDGIDLYKKLIAKFGLNRTIIVATNDQEEYYFCERLLNLAEFKTT
jgi:ABC-type multidrug transport system ATPase subunit